MNGENMVLLCIYDYTAAQQKIESCNVGQLYSISFEKEPENGLINNLIMERLFGTYQDDEELKELKNVKNLLEGRKNTDIDFIVQDKKIPAHKDVLSARSSFFSNMFSSGMKESCQKEIIIPDISSEAFEVLLEYFYQGTLPSDEGIVKELIVYSEKILLKRMKDHCEKSLIKSVVEENAVELYELSKISAAEKLRETTLELMGKNLGNFVDQLASLSMK